MYEKKPWLKFYGDVPESIDYPRVTMYEALMQTVARCPNDIAYDFFGTTSTYRQFGEEIDRCADALASLGMKKGDRITISMPTCPQGIICFYAANKLGVVASMIHPLSPAKEIEFYLNTAKSRFALTLDAFYGKFKEAQAKTGLKTLILARIPDYLPLVKKIGFNLTKGRKIPPVPADPLVRWWSDLMKGSYPKAPKAEMHTDEMAVILYSGGTTGVPKGIMLSNYNFISEGMQVAAWGAMDGADSILAILPIFHGFGLGVCVNARLHGRGKEHPRSPVHPGDRGRPDQEEAAELRRRRADPLRGPGQQSRVLEGGPELPQGDLQRGRHAPAAGQGAVRGDRERAGRQCPAPGRVWPHRGGDGDHGDPAQPVPRGERGDPLPRHAGQDRHDRGRPMRHPSVRRGRSASTVPR